MCALYSPQYKLVPVLESCIDQILNSDTPLVFTAPSEQESLEAQTLNHFIKFQTRADSRCRSLFNPFSKLHFIKNFQTTKSHKSSHQK